MGTSGAAASAGIAVAHFEFNVSFLQPFKYYIHLKLRLLYVYFYLAGFLSQFT